VRYVELLDPETGEQLLVDTSSRAVRTRFAELARRRAERLRSEFRKVRLDAVEVRTGTPFVEPLTTFFRRRERRR